MPNTGPDNLKRLHQIHVERYGRRLEASRAGAPNYRPGELVELLAFWGEVEAKNFIFDALSEPTRNEVEDAIASGE